MDNEKLPTTINTQQSVVVTNDPSSKILRSNHHISLGLIITAVASLLAVICVSLYFWFLPSMWSNSYLKNTKHLYQQQESQMAAVYQLFNHPTPVTSQNINSVYSITLSSINEAINDTNSLESKNHLTVLPGTTWHHNVLTANNERQDVQQYTSDSLVFLQDYKTLITYVYNFGTIAVKQLPALFNNVAILNKGAASSVFITDLQNATTSLESYISQLKALNPPVDLQTFNQNILTDLGDMNSALSAQQSDLETNNQTDFASQKAVYTTAFQNFYTLYNTDPSANIRSSSVIHSQLTKVEADHPIN